MHCSEMSRENELRFRLRSDSPRYEQELASIGKYLRIAAACRGGGGGGTTFEITINWEQDAESNDPILRVTSETNSAES